MAAHANYFCFRFSLFWCLGLRVSRTCAHSKVVARLLFLQPLRTFVPRLLACLRNGGYAKQGGVSLYQNLPLLLSLLPSNVLFLETPGQETRSLTLVRLLDISLLMGINPESGSDIGFSGG